MPFPYTQKIQVLIVVEGEQEEYLSGIFTTWLGVWMTICSGRSYFFVAKDPSFDIHYEPISTQTKTNQIYHVKSLLLLCHRSCRFIFGGYELASGMTLNMNNEVR